MRILHIESGPNWGGQEFRNLCEVRWLQAHGHEAWLACSPTSASFQKAPQFGVTPIGLSFSRSRYLGSLFRLWRFCRRHRVEVIQTHSSGDAWLAWPLHLLGWTVVRSRNILTPVPPNQRAFIYKHGCRHIVATADCIREGLVSHSGVPAEKISVIGESVDETKYHLGVDGLRVRAELGIAEGVPLVGMVSMLRGEKGALDFVKAALKVLRRLPEARFVIAGDGPQRAKIESILRKGLGELGLSQDMNDAQAPIRLLGYRTDVPELLAAFDLAVTPSHMEARCRVVSEAMAMGLPIVATRVGGLPEVVEDGLTGLLTPPRNPGALADAIVTLLGDPARMRHMGRRARARAEREMLESHVMAQTLAVYRRAIGMSSGAEEALAPPLELKWPPTTANSQRANIVTSVVSTRA